MGDDPDNDPDAIKSFKAEFSVEEKGVTRAASYGFVKEVEAGKEFCDISLQDFNGYNALHWATRNGRVKVMDLLIKSGADIEEVTACGQHCIHLAANYIKEKALKLLIDKGCEVDATDAAGNTALHWACRRGVNLLVKPLLDAGADLEAKNKAGATPMIESARGLVFCTVNLIKMGSNVNAQDHAGNTALHYASDMQQIETVTALLEGGADPTIRNRNQAVARDLISKRHRDLNAVFDKYESAWSSS